MADDAFDLIQDAFEAIALRGRNGILISDLWPLFPMTADPTQGGFSADAVAGARAFALRQLGDHPEVRFEQHAGSSCTLSAADLASLPPDAPVTAVASDSAITWALGVDAGTLAGLVGLPEVGGTQALPQPASSAGKRLMSALNAIASSGRNGALQSELSKRVGCGPNYLFYQLKMLEACGAVHRAPVVVPMNGSRIVSNDERVIHTAVYRLWRLQPDPPPPGPLCALHSRVSEVQALLAAAPDGILPVSEVRNHFNMRSKKHYTAWTRLKKQVYLANVARPVDVECGKGRVHCLQLLSRAEVAEEGLAQTLDVTPAEQARRGAEAGGGKGRKGRGGGSWVGSALAPVSWRGKARHELSRPPTLAQIRHRPPTLAQIRAAILQGDGETIAALRRSLQLRHKHVTSITEMLSTNYGFERRRELSGRTLSWRFFPPAAPAAAPEDSDTELDEPKKAGKDGFNFYAVHRRTRIVELLQAEHAAPVAVLRSLLQQVEHRESDSGQMARVDEKSLLRHLMVLQAEGQVELREVPWPGKGAGGDGMALSGPCMVTMVQVPGLDAGVLARIMRNLAQAKSLVNYLKVHVRSSVTKKKMPLITRAQLELTLAGNDEDMAERMARLRAEELSMGYIPARAPRAKLLHQMLLRGMCDGAPWLSWFGVLEQMRITDALVLFGIGQSTLSEALLGMAALARQTGQPSPLEAPAASLPPTLRQELLHSRLASARQNELLKILSTLGLLTKQKDELHVAMRAEMPEGAGAPAVVLRLDNEQSVSELWDRLCAAATSATHTEAAVPSIHSEAKHAAPPSDVPAANGGSIPPDLLRATQWTVERALTNWQRKRLREEEPSPIPSATPAQLEALAATVPVHPTQLEQHWAASAERLKDKLKASEAIQARAAAEARAEEARAAAVVAMTRGAGLDEPTARRPRLLVVQARQLDEADFEAEAVQAVPMEWEAAAPVKWTEASRAQLVDAYAEQIEAMLRSGGGAGSAASPSISQAVTAASHLVDWTAVGVRLGVPPHRCSCALPRLLCAPQDATRRLALRQNLLNRLHAAPVSAEAAGGAAADVVSALGIQLDVSGDVLLPRLREATRMETPREVRKGRGLGTPPLTGSERCAADSLPRLLFLPGTCSSPLRLSPSLHYTSSFYLRRRCACAFSSSWAWMTAIPPPPSAPRCSSASPRPRWRRCRRASAPRDGQASATRTRAPPARWCTSCRTASPTPPREQTRAATAVPLLRTSERCSPRAAIHRPSRSHSTCRWAGLRHCSSRLLQGSCV